MKALDQEVIDQRNRSIDAQPFRTAERRERDFDRISAIRQRIGVLEVERFLRLDQMTSSVTKRLTDQTVRLDRQHLRDQRR